MKTKIIRLAVIAVLLVLSIGGQSIAAGRLTPGSQGGLLAPLDLSGLAITPGSLTLSTLTAGQILYAGVGGLLSGSSTLFFDTTNARVGIGNFAPSSTLHVTGSISNTATTTLATNGSAMVGVGTGSPSSTLHVSGGVQFSGAGSVASPSIGGGALLAGACASATSTVDTSITSSTAAFVTTPQNYPGDGAEWFSYLSSPGLITTKVCALVSVTPAATAYNVKIIK